MTMIGPRTYCFLRTENQAVLQRLAALGLHDCPLEPVHGSSARYLTSEPVAEPTYARVINDLGDWELPDFTAATGPAALKTDSLLSCARLQPGVFGCCTDFFGIRTHSWRQDDDGTFVCSNNPLVVAHLTGAAFDEAGIAESLFFLSPQHDRTLFAGIRSLLPGQELRYHPDSGRLELGAAVDPAAVILAGPPDGADYRAEFRDFFARARAQVGAGGAAVGLSSGTDSTTVLAGLRAAGIDAAATSFGMPHYFEARMTRATTRKLGVPLTMVPLLTGPEWERMLLPSSFRSGGALNPLRVHYQKLYDAVPEGRALFEGTLGSQFVKGDFPAGSAISECQINVLRSRGSVREVIDRFLGPLPESWRSRVEQVVQDLDGEAIRQVVAGPQYRAFREYALNNLPGRMFGGPLLIAGDMLPLYLPYIHPRFLSALYASGIPSFGTAPTLLGPLPQPRKMRIQGAIVRQADPQLYRRTLSSGLSFRDACTLPEKACSYLRSLRNKLNRRLFHRDAFFGQIDNSVAEDAVGSYLAGRQMPWGDWDLARAETRLRMSACNLTINEELVARLGSDRF